MKKLGLVVLFAVFALAGSALFAAPPEGWTTDYNKALATAKVEKKHVLVLFTGSDWCPWCIRLRNDVLNKPEFKNFAAKNLVLVFFDNPQKNPPSAAQLKLQKELAQKLGAGRGVPSTVIVSPDGKALKRIGGYRPLAQYLSDVKAAIAK